MEDGYCVKWEKHHNAIVSVFDNLYKQNVLVDCTLAAENKLIKAHRIVLMACSPYFEEILSQHSDNYPIVWLNMKFTELEALIDFCYRGEVRLPQAQLPGFLNAARLLHIKGLCESTENYRKRKHLDGGGDAASLARKKYRSVTGLVSQVSSEFGDCANQVISEANDGDAAAEEEDDSHNQTVQTNGDSLGHTQGDENSDRSDLDTDEESSAGEEKESIVLDDLLKGSGSAQFPYRWTCSKCGVAFPTRTTYHDHKRGCTADPSIDHPWRCHKCPNTYKNKKGLVRHLLYCGNETERHICERCGSTYKYERGLKRHKIYCGTDVKPMVCNACGKTYKYKRGLRRHQKQQCGLIESFLENRSGKVRNDEPSSKSPTKVVSLKSPTTVSKHSEQAAEDEISSETPIKEGNTPAVCQTCGKVYKYRKSYLNHVVNCVPSADDGNEGEDESDDVPKATDVRVEVHASQDDDEPDPEEEIKDDQLPDDDQPMDEKAMEQEIDELVALKKQLESEETKSDDKDPVVDETRNNNTDEPTPIDEKTNEEPPET